MTFESIGIAAMMPYILLDLHPEFPEALTGGILGFWDTPKIAALSFCHIIRHASQDSNPSTTTPI